ncbi:unnamed protein product [Phaedon cochleariae]|uniref:RecA family profile 1 domain-containing protein n=1 Tax=Phaedon cochleariae TaxID=80249 RepID=A0A9P0GX76_PHACE|nr:unnamed protein product [Phaedon cochleariae]
MDELQNLVEISIWEKLRKGEADSPLSILVRDNESLMKETGLSCKELEEVKATLSNIVFRSQFLSADIVEPWDRVSTGCQNIDSLMRGGIPINGITEIFGCSGVGKTQFCLQLSLQIQLPYDLNGKEKGVVYICTEDPFPSKRLHQLSESFKEHYKLPQIDFESNIFVDHSADLEQLKCCLSVRLPNLIRLKNIGLIVLDSIAGPFRSENSKTNYTSRGRELCDISSSLNQLCEEFKIAVVCVNQVTEDVVNDKTEPCLGLAWSNNVTYRCQISRFNDTPTREFEIIFAPDLPCSKCYFGIRKDGLVSIDDVR